MRKRLCWLWLALFISQVPILTILQGSGLTGATFSAVFICSVMAALVSCGRFKPFAFGPADIVFALFLAAIACSIFINGSTATSKDYVLLALSCTAYVAGRGFPERVPSTVFLAVTASIVAIGAVATAVATIQQASSEHGKPLVFNRFDAAPAEFLISSAFLLFALMSRKMTRPAWLAWGAGLAATAVIFAAAEVRYAFAAIGATLLIATWGARALPRKAVLAILAVLILGAVAGFCTRPAMSEATLAQILSPADCSNPDSSIAIRKMMLSEAVHLIPKAGLFGFGLSGFMSRSCIANTEVHNSVLQAFVEFGWIGGLLFIALLGTAIASTWAGLQTSGAMFGMLGLCFALLMSMAHGRLTEDSELMFFVGWAAQWQSSKASDHS